MTVAALAVMLAVPVTASAQGGPGFLFRRPLVSVGIRAGYAVPRAGGDLFGQTRNDFIPSGADPTGSSLSFNSPYLGGELAIRPWDRWDIAVGFGWTRSRTLSEYRDWLDSSDNPIEQETTFQVVSGTLGAKYYLQDRGRRVGSLTWVPQRLSPYVGAGIGVASYEFLQEGDFVDTSTFVVYPDYLKTSGEGFIWYGAAGADLVLGRNAILTGEARYSFSNARVAGSYDGFDNIDLAGLQLMVGFGFQF
jgi:opacity protein-like surface antigen